MADNVIVSTATTGATIAAENIGSVEFQRIKLIGGQLGSTQPIPGDSALGLGVQVLNVPQVAISSMPTVAGASITIQQGASVSLPAVAGVVASSVPATSVALGLPVWIVGGQTATGVPVLVSHSAVVAAATQLATTGIPIWLAPTQTLAPVQISTSQTIGTIITVIGLPAVSVSASAVLGTVIAVSALSTIINTIPVSVSHPAFSGVIASSVQPTSVALGVPVWIVGGQTATGFPVLVSASVSVSVSITGAAIATTTQSPATGAIVWFAPTQTLAPIQISTSQTIGTVVTVLGAVLVSHSAVVAAVTQANTTGVPIWLAPTQTLGPVQISSIVAAVTQAVTTGVPVWLCPTQTVQITIPASQTIGTIVTVLGTQLVSLARPAGAVLMSVTGTSVIATSTTQFMLITVPFDAYTSSQPGSGYTIRAPFQITGISMTYSGTSVTALSVFLAVYVTTSGVALTSNGVPLWTTIFPTFTGAGVATTLNFPFTMLLPQGGVMGLAVYRSSSATITLNVAFTMTGQYIG